MPRLHSITHTIDGRNEIIRAAARVAHEVNRAYCQVLGDDTQPSWDDADDWLRDSALIGVAAAISDREITPAAIHEQWKRKKLADGWVWGETKDPERKLHPCLVESYADLPPSTRAKDVLFLASARAVADGWPEKLRETYTLIQKFDPPTT